MCIIIGPSIIRLSNATLEPKVILKLARTMYNTNSVFPAFILLFLLLFLLLLLLEVFLEFGVA